MTPLVSVIICSHGPRADYLEEVLRALRGQTLPFAKWELLLVDNASDEPLADRWDLDWHPYARHLREEELGLTPARLAGIEAAAAPVLVFVDDDVVLSPDYLAGALEIAETWPILGAWGAGRAEGRFETEPPGWARPYLPWMAVFREERVIWSNIVNGSPTVPVGAGLCVRAEVAREYRRHVVADSARRRLDRRGAQLLSAGDSDLAYTACDLGLGTGRFPSLNFTHLIPAHRLTLEYLELLLEASTYSDVVLRWCRGEAPRAPRSPGPLRRLLAWYRSRRMPTETRRLEAAMRRGAQRAAIEILQLKTD